MIESTIPSPQYAIAITNEVINSYTHLSTIPKHMQHQTRCLNNYHIMNSVSSCIVDCILLNIQGIFENWHGKVNYAGLLSGIFYYWQAYDLCR